MSNQQHSRNSDHQSPRYQQQHGEIPHDEVAPTDRVRQFPQILELHAICLLHKQAVETFEQGRIEASRLQFIQVYDAVTRVLKRNTTSRSKAQILVAPGSPIVRTSTWSPRYLETPPQSTRTKEELSDLNSVRLETSMNEKSDDDEACQEQQDSSSASSVVSEPPQRGLHRPHQGETTSSLTSEHQDATEDDLDIYANVLHLPPAGKLSVNHFAFVPLYNLAVTTHLVAIEKDNEQKRAQEQEPATFQKAIKLWEMAYNFQRCNNFHLNLKTLHALSILNNLGHAYLAVGYLDKSRQCAESLMSALQVMEGRRQVVQQKSFFLSRAIRVMLLLPGGAELQTASTKDVPGKKEQQEAGGLSPAAQVDKNAKKADCNPDTASTA